MEGKSLTDVDIKQAICQVHPRDLLDEILVISNIGLKSLGIFQSVMKSWLAFFFFY